VLTDRDVEVLYLSDLLAQMRHLPAAMKESAGGRSLQVWLKEGETTTSLGVYDPRDGAGFSFLAVMPKPGQQIVITMEPAGGSAQPTTPPLVTLRVSEDAGRSGAADRAECPAGVRHAVLFEIQARQDVAAEHPQAVVGVGQMHAGGA